MLIIVYFKMCSTLSTRVSLSIEKDGVDYALRNILFTLDENGDTTPTTFEVLSPFPSY